MITDHGVRTLYEDTLHRGYLLERDGKFDMAIARYNDALNIAKSYKDSAEIERCRAIISSAKNKMNDRCF